MPADNMFRCAQNNPEFLDPNKVAETAGSFFVGQMFETLLVPAPGNTPVRPGQAERWEVSADGLTYTFHLRPGLVWSDGVPITARTFRDSWLRGLDPKTASRNAEQLWYIKGAKAFNTGTETNPGTVAIRAVDDLTLEVELTSPAAFFPELATYTAYAPVPLHVIEAHGAHWTRPENIVVNGPFILTEFAPRDRATMKKNPRYWDAANVDLDGVIIFSSDSESRNELLYETGQIHWAYPLGPDHVATWLKSGRSDLHVVDNLCTYYYVMNTTRPPFDDKRVRHAFNQAIDKRRLTTSVLSSFQQPAPNLLADSYRGRIGYVPVAGDDFDAVAARAALADAGYPRGAGFPKVELLFNTFELHRQIADFATRSIAENLGVELTSSNMEWKSLLKLVQSGDFSIARTSWCGDYTDPYTFLGVFAAQSKNNYPRYANPVYDGLLDRIRKETDNAERNALICAAEKVLNRDLPIIPLYFYTRAYLLRPEVSGFLPQILDDHYLKWVSLRGRGGE
ncbi:MAG: peptide ABC transporter substrate-binding protein [Deltaproteobacteria bacterium]|nr:peptide ABC transporter substrate-binding protein [Deltaproteobacteria bacterium]